MNRILLSTRAPIVNTLISDRAFRDHVIAWKLTEDLPEDERLKALAALEHAQGELEIFKNTIPKIGSRESGLAFGEVKRSLTPAEINGYKKRVPEKA